MGLLCEMDMGPITAHLRRFHRRYNYETVEAIHEAQAHARGEIELEEGYIPSGGHLLKIHRTPEYESELKHMIGNGADLDELGAVLNILANGGTLPRRYRDRQLRGGHRGACECRINPDMILTYSIDGEGLTLIGIRTDASRSIPARCTDKVTTTSRCDAGLERGEELRHLRTSHRHHIVRLGMLPRKNVGWSRYDRDQRPNPV